jgi:hypothetical protein
VSNKIVIINKKLEESRIGGGIVVTIIGTTVSSYKNIRTADIPTGSVSKEKHTWLSLLTEVNISNL